jgi:hypothetical protein
MAFKLDKKDKERRDLLVDQLREAWGKIEDAVEVYNIEVSKLRADVDKAVSDYNEVIEEARGFAEDVATQAESEYDDKSEKWQQGEKGQSAAAWRDEWQGLEADALDASWPDDYSIDDPEHADKLEGLPEEAE